MLNCLIISAAFWVSLLILAGLAFYLYWHYRQQQTEERRDFKMVLVDRLREGKSETFDMGDFIDECQVSRSAASQVSEELYGQLCAKVVADGVIAPEERAKLDRLAHTLSLNPSKAQAIEQRLKGKRYTDLVVTALANGKIAEAEEQSLKQLRKNFGLTGRQAFELTASPAREGYLALFRNVVSDGQITDAELKELERYRQALALSNEEAHRIVEPEAERLYSIAFARVVADGIITPAEHEQLRRFRDVLGLTEQIASDIVRKRALALYRQLFSEIRQDGEVTEQEEGHLDRLQKTLSLTRIDVAPYLAELAELKRLAAYRRGNLPTVQARHLLESGEICHWVGECTYAWETTTTSKNAVGELIVTSIRLIFASPVKSFAFSPAKIIDIQAYTNGLQLATSASKGAGNYLTANAQDLEAILVGVVRKHKYLLCETFSSSRTRHIPHTVKIEVWYRDGGKCAHCSSSEYLEYDHIIPHGKGGANTVNNVQLLCRRCNLLKSDRI